MRIGLDIDGVIRPWHISMYRYFQSLRGYEGDERQFWDYFRELPKDTQHYFVSIPLMYLDTMPTQDVLTYVPKIAELAEIYYITACPEELWWATGKFFSMYNLPFKENIIFSKDKANYVRLLGLEYFLDDLAHNLESLQGLTKTYLFKASHNWRDRDKFPLINNMKEFYEILKDNHEQENNSGSL